MKTSDFNYNLPPDRIAQEPVEPRHSSRLLVIRRGHSELEHSSFWDLDRFLSPGDLLVINRTRVIPARIFGSKATGGKVEILLLSRIDELTWRVLIGAKGLKVGQEILVPDGPSAEIVCDLGGTERMIKFNKPIEPYLPRIGNMPLPPYIHTHLDDPDRYQTVYSKEPGSAAAPTAGLHFTHELIEKLKGKGILFAEVILHVGLDTFAPVNEDDPSQHKIHTEWCSLSNDSARLINETRKNGRKVVAVGTTTVRTLETAARFVREGESVAAFTDNTELFILPGYKFRVVDAMITNFHLPRSTLLMLVSAFLGRERILEVYQEAIRLTYRFYSFGDAMLIL